MRHEPSQRASLGRFYAKRGARRVITRSDAVQTNDQRIAEWASRYYLVPVEMRLAPIRRTEAK